MAGRPDHVHVTEEMFEEAWDDDGSGACVLCGKPHHDGLDALRGDSTPLIGDHPLSRDLVYHDHMIVEAMLREAKVGKRGRLAIHRFLVDHDRTIAMAQERIAMTALVREWFPRGLGEYMVQVHEHEDGRVAVHAAPVSIVGKIGDPPKLHGHPEAGKGPVVH